MTSRTHRTRRGFTLIEVLLVIVILGLLAGVGIMAFSGIGEGAKVDTTKLKIDEVEGAIELYKTNIGHLPTEEEGGLTALREEPTFEDEKLAEKWRGPYLKEEPTDAWGNELNYRVETVESESGSREVARIWSSGPDGQSETEDDIKNWSDEAAADM